MSMQVDEIAIGATYQLRAKEVGNPLVVVEEVSVNYHVMPGFWREAGWQARTLVYVYEAARGCRYPCDPRHLQRH